jgi:RNA polymerase sigma factor (sigma-70 family)
MVIGSPGKVPKYLQTLFDSGRAGDLPDGVLLERFVSARDEAAFEVLVARHGPMVLRVCRAALADPDEADDAFQAVFLILVRRAASIRSRGSLASWLFGVASRVSARARVDAGRRRRHEREAGARRPAAAPADVDARPDPAPVLHEELARLPDRYREAIVLCYFEGHTCDAVARRLRRPVGTIKARLCRARGMLRQRLIRRGVTLPAGLLATGIATEASATVVPATLAPVPAALSRMTVAVACRTAAGAAAASARVSLLAKGVLKAMFLRKLTLAAVLSIPAVLVAGTVLIAHGSPGPRDEPGPKADARVGQTPADPVNRQPVGKIGGDDPASVALRDALPAAATTADPYYFTFALIRLAKARNASGDREGTLAAFRLADQVAGTVKDQHLRRLAMMRTAVARGRLGDTEPARATLGHFAREADGLGPEARYNLMSMVIDFLYQAGFKAEAAASLKAELAVVDAIADERLRDGGIHRFLYSQITMGDYDGPLRQAERYTGQRSNYRASLIGITMRYRSLATDPPPPRKAVERALELSREVTYPYPRAMAEAQIAPALARSGDIEGALRLAREIGKDDSGPFREGIRAEIPAAMAEIARIQARAGDLDGARKTLREAWAHARTVTQRDTVLFERIRRIGEAAAEIGDVEAARMAADEIDDDAMEKALALVALARAKVRAGDAKGARATLGDALTHARGIGPRAHFINDNPVANGDRVFREVALAQAEAGDAKGALATAASRGTDAWKSETLAAIAPIRARQGDVPGALATARSIPEAARAGEAYCEIASVQARTEGAEAALAWAARLEPPAARAYALIGITEGVAAQQAEKRAGRAQKP